MSESYSGECLERFGVGIAVVSGAVLAALVFRRAARSLRVPAPVVFLLGAAVASDVFAPLRTALSPRDVSWIASAALIVILFDGGVSIGWRNVRPLVGAVTVLGLGATLIAAAVLGLAAHVLLGFDWATSTVIGVALAPTDRPSCSRSSVRVS